jgi:single-stranded DNA-binding protein
MVKMAEMHDQFEYLNEVAIVGRLSGSPIEKDLPSGDKVVELRIVVGRDKNQCSKAKYQWTQ